MSANEVKASGAIPSLWPGLSGEDAEGPYLEGAMCSACGTVTLGLRALCPQCWAQDSMQQLKLGRTGTVYTRTVIHQAPEGFEAQADLGELFGSLLFSAVGLNDRLLERLVADAQRLDGGFEGSDIRGLRRTGPRPRGQSEDCGGEGEWTGAVHGTDSCERLTSCRYRRGP